MAKLRLCFIDKTDGTQQWILNQEGHISEIILITKSVVGIKLYPLQGFLFFRCDSGVISHLVFAQWWQLIEHYVFFGNLSIKLGLQLIWSFFAFRRLNTRKWRRQISWRWLWATFGQQWVPLGFNKNVSVDAIIFLMHVWYNGQWPLLPRRLTHN